MVISIQVNQKIELQTQLEENLEIVGFQNELEQVILNIVNNGKDALLETKPINPKIEIKAFKEKEFKVITIEDNAGGVSEDIIDKVFDSYFTTKGDKGTGIGLNLAKLIVQDSLNGEISVKNTDKGALFTVKLPI